MVVIIDGLFYASTPVWQRELLSALDEGITVIGSTSMGALRAAELYPYGMIGYGKVFTWYRDDIIEGDDEVALFHLDADDGYRGISEPLVNIRYNLHLACEKGLINMNESADIIASLKLKYFGDRCYEALFKSPPFRSLSPSVQDRLQEFLTKGAVNLKRIDAIETLKLIADGEIFPIPARARKTDNRKSPQGLIGVLMRGALTDNGELVPLSKVIESILSDREFVLQLLTKATRRFYLMQWIEERGLEPPDTFTKVFYESWVKRYVTSEKDEWLRKNGLTEKELNEELNDRAGIAWLLEKGPDSFGLEFKGFPDCLEALLGKNEPLAENHPRQQGYLHEAIEDSFISGWAQISGISCPGKVIDDFLQAWQHEQAIEEPGNWLSKQNISKDLFQRFLAVRATVRWLIEKGPAYFGNDTWVPDFMILRDLQVTGQVAGLAEKLKEKNDA
ncbi:MAG: TfuA-like protein [Chloroflexota bacterium]